MRVTRKELADILKISLGSLKNLEIANELEQKLYDRGYTFISKEKIGRNNYYTLEKSFPEKEEFSNVCKDKFKTTNTKAFSCYFVERTENTNKPITKKDIANKSGVSVNTINKWDKIMINEKIISKCGGYYFCIEWIEGDRYVYQCSHEEYSEFWRANGYDKALKRLEERYEQGEITLEEVTKYSAQYGALISEREGRFCYKVSRYRVDKNNQLYIDTKDLIYKLFYRD